jgi:hypothetical protein
MEEALSFLPECIITSINDNLKPATTHRTVFTLKLNKTILKVYILANDRILLLIDEEALIISPGDGDILWRQHVICTTGECYLTPDTKSLLVFDTKDGYYYHIGETKLQLRGKKIGTKKKCRTNISFVTNTLYVEWKDNCVTIWDYKRRSITVRNLPIELAQVTQYFLQGENTVYCWDENTIFVTDIIGTLFKKIPIDGIILQVYSLDEDRLIITKRNQIYQKIIWGISHVKLPMILL